jgi:multidrug resistance efflux pump
MLVDLLLHSVNTRPALSKAAVAALAAVAYAQPAKSAEEARWDLALEEQVYYSWHPEVACVKALWTIIWHRACQGTYAAPVEGHVEQLMVQWLGVYDYGEPPAPLL